jgi:hypothetical protein
MKKKSTWKVEAQRSEEGGNSEFNAMEGSFGAIRGCSLINN